MRENQFQDSHRLCKGTKDALIENFTSSFAEEVARPPSGEGVDRYENATTPQLFASNEASRDIFQPVRHSLSGKGCLVVPEIGVGEREGWKSIERGKREKEKERRIEMAIHAPINGIRCRRNGVTRSGHVLHDDAKCELLCFQEKKKRTLLAKPVGKLLSSFISSYFSLLLYIIVSCKFVIEIWWNFWSAFGVFREDSVQARSNYNLNSLSIRERLF